MKRFSSFENCAEFLENWTQLGLEGLSEDEYNLLIDHLGLSEAFGLYDKSQTCKEEQIREPCHDMSGGTLAVTCRYLKAVLDSGHSWQSIVRSKLPDDDCGTLLQTWDKELLLSALSSQELSDLSIRLRLEGLAHIKQVRD